MSYLPFAIQQKAGRGLLVIALSKRHPAFPDVPTFRELGFNWVDGAYRGIAVSKPTSRDDPAAGLDTTYALNRTPACASNSTDGGYDVIDVTLEKMPAFLAERSRAYIDDAKAAGLLK